MTQHCTLRITLEGSSPEIWRRVSVPADWSLYDLHQVIQTAMPWGDEHLHAFNKGKQGYSLDPAYGEEDEGVVELRSVLPRERSKLTYTYDFGDTWVHEIVSEGMTERPEEHAACLGGERAAPPEEIGGVWGYESLLADLEDPKNAEDPERLEWFEKFDPAELDIDAINAVLATFDTADLPGNDDVWTDELVEEMAAHYDAEAAPSDDFWDFDEDEQCLIIEAYHRLRGEEVPPSGLHVHSLFHHIVENQLREKNPKQARPALKRLLAAGLDRHEAIHALAATNADVMLATQKGDEKAIARLGPDLAALTVESWRARSDPWEPKSEDLPADGPDSDDLYADDDYELSRDLDSAPAPRKPSPVEAKKRKDKRKAQKQARKRSRR